MSALSAVFTCLPGLSLVVSVLFRWPCSISIHLSPRSLAAGVRPFPLATQHFYSFPNQCTFRGSQFFLKTCPPFSAGHAAFQFICIKSGFFTFVSQVRCALPVSTLIPESAGHAAFLFICLPYDLFTFIFQVRCLRCWPPPFSPFQHFYSFVSQVVSVLPRTGYILLGVFKAF